MNDTCRRCRVCGYDLHEPPWSQDGLTPTYLICPCCGGQAGYEDTSPETARRYRDKWVAEGRPWWSALDHPPKSLDLDDQMTRIPELYR